MMRWMMTMGVGIAAIAAAGDAAAQMLPFERTDAGRARAELHATVLGEFQDVMGEWVRAINARDVPGAAALYADDAFVHLGDTAVGRDLVEDFLHQWVATLGSVSFGLAHFDASSSLSYAAGSLTITGNGANAQRGTMVLVLRRQGKDDWRIRSQTLLLE